MDAAYEKRRATRYLDRAKCAYTVTREGSNVVPMGSKLGYLRLDARPGRASDQQEGGVEERDAV